MINACFFQEAKNYTRNYFKIHVEFFFITLFTFKLVNIFILEMYACMCRLVNSSSYIIIEIDQYLVSIIRYSGGALKRVTFDTWYSRIHHCLQLQDTVFFSGCRYSVCLFVRKWKPWEVVICRSFITRNGFGHGYI